jgi:hypothetical protein
MADALYRVQLNYQDESLLPEDAIVHTVYLRDSAASSDFTAIANGVIDAFIGPGKWYVSNNETRCKIYDVSSLPVHSGPPLIEVRRNLGVVISSGAFREQALCLSYYTGVNTPRTRGRFFLGAAAGGAAGGLRPNTATRTRALAVGTRLGAVGGSTVQWQHYSPTLNQMRPVTDLWVDDEWDVVRSRGLKATARDKLAVTA